MKTSPAQQTIRDLAARNRLKAKLAKKRIAAADMTSAERRHLRQMERDGEVEYCGPDGVWKLAGAVTP